MSLTIIEIINRSEQGATRPFLCRGDDKVLYYIKGNYAGRSALCREWVASRLGRLFGLPIPEFSIATVPQSLIQDSDIPDVGDLGIGNVFASQLLEKAQEFSFSDIGNIEHQLRMKVLLFDWWVHNEDRTLSKFGGNPNLLWTRQNGDLGVFDLNLAFDEEFNEDLFWKMHVFSHVVSSWPEQFQIEMTSRMDEVMTNLRQIWAELPVEWLYADGDSTGESILNFEAVERLLSRFRVNPDNFWTIIK